MYLFGLGLTPAEVKARFSVDLCGEVTLDDTPVLNS